MKDSPSQNDIDTLLAYFKEGKFNDVEKLAISLTKEHPNHPFGWKALGIAFKSKGEISKSLEVNKKVLEIDPKDPEAHYNIGNTFKLLDNFEEAKNSYKNAIKINPNYFQAYNNLGSLFHDNKKFNEAQNNYKKVISLNPNFAEAFNNLGVTLKELGNLDEAEENYKKAISLKTNYFEAYNNLGILLREQKRFKESENNYKKAIEINPNFAEAYSNLGILLREIGKLQDSKLNYIKAINLKSDYAEAHYNLGITYREIGDLKNAEASYKTALKFNPKSPEIYNNLGVTLRELLKLDESEIAYKKAIELKDDYADAYNNLSFTLLLKNNFKDAFELSEWRWQTDQNIGKKFLTKKPLWNGEVEKSILIWKEQGIGDEIMYSSILPEIKKISKKVIVHCDKRLIPLFKRSFAQDIIYESNKQNIEEDDYDYHIPFGSLSRYFRQNLKSFLNSSKGFLKNEIKNTLSFKEKLKENVDVKLIGISWNTKSNLQMASFRNIDLNYLTSVLNNNKVKFVNLQYGDTSEEIYKLKQETGIQVTEIPDLDIKNEIDKLASLVAACDIIVSIDNFTVHLAGSLGIETKVLLPFNMDSRWGLKGKNSHLYDSVTLYRQNKLGNWVNAIDELKKDIKL